MYIAQANLGKVRFFSVTQLPCITSLLHRLLCLFVTTGNRLLVRPGGKTKRALEITGYTPISLKRVCEKKSEERRFMTSRPPPQYHLVVALYS